MAALDQRLPCSLKPAWKALGIGFAWSKTGSVRILLTTWVGTWGAAIFPAILIRGKLVVDTFVFVGPCLSPLGFGTFCHAHSIRRGVPTTVDTLSGVGLGASDLVGWQCHRGIRAPHGVPNFAKPCIIGFSASPITMSGLLNKVKKANTPQLDHW
ncbi:hypothetical protein V8C86DRAFT_1370999 [Haematococcus lacustris]